MRRDIERLMRWYPAAWRARYGDEFSAMLDDELSGGRLTWHIYRDVARAALGERLRHGGLTGDSAQTEVALRSGALTVLYSWAFLLIGTAGFTKLAEHFATTISPHARAVPTIAYRIAEIAVASATVLVFLGAVLVTTSVSRFLHRGGWSVIRRSVWRTALAGGLSSVGLLVLARWAHHLTPAARNGTNALYGATFLTWAAVTAVTVLLTVDTVRRTIDATELSPRLLTIEVRLAVAVATCASVAVAAIITWIGSVAIGDPALLNTHASTEAALTSMPVVATTSVAILAIVLTTLGEGRIVRTTLRARHSRA